MHLASKAKFWQHKAELGNNYVTIYHENDYHDNRYYHDIIQPNCAAMSTKTVNYG